MLLDGGIWALRKVLEDYMGEAVWPAKPPDILGNYASSSCSVAWAT